MRSFSLLLTFIFAGVCLGAEPASTPTQTGEPSYQGKTLSEWTTLTKDKDEQVRRAAVVALGNIGAKTAIPVLTELLNDKNADVRRWAAVGLGNIGSQASIPALIEVLKDENALVRLVAAEARWANRSNWLGCEDSHRRTHGIVQRQGQVSPMCRSRCRIANSSNWPRGGDSDCGLYGTAHRPGFADSDSGFL